MSFISSNPNLLVLSFYEKFLQQFYHLSLMASLWFQNDLNANLIGQEANEDNDQSVRNSQIITDTAKAEKGYDLCQLCSKQRPPNKMYTIASNEQCEHYFCLSCLNQRIVSCILKNMDTYCPIDHCQSILNPQSKLFASLPEKTIAKYQQWKNSKAYKSRNTALRMSFYNSILESQKIQEDVQEIKIEINASEKRQSKNQLHQEEDEQIVMRQEVARSSIQVIRQENKQRKSSGIMCLFMLILFLVMLPCVFTLFLVFLTVTLLIIGLYIAPIIGFFGELAFIVYQLASQEKPQTQLYLDIGGAVLCLVLMIFLCCHYKRFIQIIKSTWQIWGKIWSAFCSILSL